MSKLLIFTFLVALAICANAADSGRHLRWAPFWWHPELQDLRFQIQFNQPSKEVVQDPIKNKIYVDMYINHWI